MAQEQLFENVKRIKVVAQDDSTISVVISLEEDVLVTSEYEFTAKKKNGGFEINSFGDTTVRIPKNDAPEVIVDGLTKIIFDLP